jgi:hypothetical protein
VDGRSWELQVLRDSPVGVYLVGVQERADHSYIQGFSASRSAIDQAHETIILRR